MTTEPVAAIARNVAQHLTTDHNPALIHQVEAALHQRTATAPTPPARYTDPVAIASLIVAIATVAWTVYNDLRKETPRPPIATITRTIRLQLDETHTIDDTTRRIIDITAEETIKYGDR
ncbi:hypothetical protein F4553_008013 [Allocatelliglobosispora scoriae]|uniref:Uncharacterized protein n=1 Tax=Allocatelliglobosispora scoriae TaxID=643052 RepID=A0A841C5L0_9ACTN|nr:hypothetical protein [Allocatelliglobosispora scoriae]MBB5874579.1 hypothetical protein [Allocatelliglobosispora scoriae]